MLWTQITTIRKCSRHFLELDSEPFQTGTMGHFYTFKEWPFPDIFGFRRLSGAPGFRMYIPFKVPRITAKKKQNTEIQMC